MSDFTTNGSIDVGVIKEIVIEHMGVPLDPGSLEPERDLASVGLTSLATVSLMLALEDRFDVEFPDSMLSRDTFRSIVAIAEAVATLTH